MVNRHWAPADVLALETAIDQSSVEETTFLAFKRFPTRYPSGRESFAADLGFAIRAVRVRPRAPTV